MSAGPVADDWSIRPWPAGDALDALTALLHRAYAPLAAAGMSFTAATQTPEMTAQRMQGARKWTAARRFLADDATPMADGRVHSLLEVRHGGHSVLAHTLRRFRGALVVQADETWATWEVPPDWRTAEAIGAHRRDGDDRHAGNASAARP